MTHPRPGNLLNDLPIQRADGKEHFKDILKRTDVRLERIVSHGQSSPDGFWYDQDEDEWVLVLKGQAKLQLQAPEELVALQEGDHLFIQAHRRHRVVSTACPTVWLALWIPSE